MTTTILPQYSTTPPSATTQVQLNTAQMEPPQVDEQAHNDREAARKKWFGEMRGSIMVVAVLVASVTYTTGLSPPGGLWQDDLNGHKASTSILHDNFPDRYTTFFYANATAFMASLVIIILLMNENIYCDWSKVIVLNICMVLDLVSLMIAYAAGCARRLSTSFYVIVLAVGVLLFVLNTVHFLPTICQFAKKCCPWIENIVGRDCFPPPKSGAGRREVET